ncbi:3'(2'),5'-bisphosphate nucleotidase CysQ [Rickettsiella endosymbiont of Xylota segnis]|uniref:3'(2'),5'-bisphosphate nucleotidase CysQ n=1 Tax=Rickettsiella endosymbiont of Xylota segnis TaxID=3066238 RepID=UPI0030CABDB8
MNSLLNDIVSLAKQAGNQVCNIYQSDFTVEYKADKSPITVADLASHDCICQGLRHLTPDLPIISEESVPISFQKRRSWEKYWLIDPLDGTKEFLEKNGEFTINIALIEQHKPSLGVIFVPSKNICYFASKGIGAYKQIGEAQPKVMLSRDWKEEQSITAVISRRHGMEKLKKFLAQFSSLNLLYCGSALKFCWLAEGLADIYPRFSPTFEWDTAAGQCILKEAGGLVIDNTGQELQYNMSSSLQIANFLAVADKRRHWLHYLKS